MKKTNLESYGITESELRTTYNDMSFEVKILNKYFSNLEILKPLTPKERRLLVRQKSRNYYKELLNNYPNKEYELIGTKIRPIGLLGVLSGKQILELKECESVNQIIITKADNLKQIIKVKEKEYFSVKGLFAIKVEGFDYTNSIRFTEERIVLVKAIDMEKATELAEIEFKQYSDCEYLNSDFKLTRWEYIKLIDIYGTDVSEIDDKGTEVFSVTRNKKIGTTVGNNV